MNADAVTLHRDLPDSVRDAAAALYWDAFRGKLGPILNDEDGPRLLSETFNRDRAIVAFAGSDLVGLAGLQYGGRAFAGITWPAVRRRYGWVRGALKICLLALLDRTNKPGELLMDGIVVAAEARGRGIGSRLLDEVVEVAREQGFHSVRLDVVDTNPAARRLYERKGFAAVATTNVPWLRRWMGFGAATTLVKAL